MSRSLMAALFLLASSALLGQVDPPVTNWTVPPYNRSSSGITTMTDFTPPRVFVAVTPCRVVDTRNAPGPYGGPALSTNVARTFDIDNGPCPGLPTGIEAYSLNFGGILPPADGFLTAWPTGISQPVVSQLNLVGGEVVANAAIVPAGTNGAINVLVNIGPTHVYIDINGYFSDTLGTPQNHLTIINNSTQFSIFTDNQSTTCGDSCGISAWVGSTAGGIAVTGYAYGTSGINYGVSGATESSTDGAAGVRGLVVPTTGITYGVLGRTFSASPRAAGVLGRNGQTFVPQSYLGSPAGVRGESEWHGVLGVSSQGNGVTGLRNDPDGNLVAEGRLGSGIYAVYGAVGPFGGTGAKYFIEPHPTDAAKVIRYIALEGREPGTYVRGRGKFERGIARITVPEDFRMVTDEEGLSVQITPIGAMATVAVLKADLNEIIVQSSRNVEFYYLVHGIRRTHKHLTSPIGDGDEYRPGSAEARMPRGYTEAQKQLLVQNGTYNEDGTVNMETARRLGWDRRWVEHERKPSPEPALK